MNQQILNFVLFIQLPCAVFVYIDSRKRETPNFWFWVAGVALFMPLFLPFYVLLRPREAFFYCPDCRARNVFPVEHCRKCDFEIKQADDISLQGEWRLSDAMAIFVLAIFTLPISLTGFTVALGLTERDSTSWISSFSFSFIGSVLLAGLPIWFILKVCKRSLSDAGVTRDRLYRNIILGIVLVVPVLFMEYVVEEIVVRASIAVAPSQAEAIQGMRDKENRQGAELMPKSPDELLKLIAAGFLLVILSPIGEEILFRGIVYTALRRRGKLRAMIITSILFAILHMQLIHFVPIILVSYILVYLVERTGSLVPAITLHFSHNLILIFLWYYYPSLCI